MYCQKCGSELGSEVSMCPKCGAFTGTTEQTGQSPKSRSKLVYILAGILGVAIVAGIVALLMLRGRPITQGEQTVSNSGPAITNTEPPTPGGGPAITNAAPAQPSPASPTNTPPKKPNAPQTVIDYINFVKQVEASRQALLRDTARAISLSAGAAQAQSLIDAIDMAMDDSPQDKPKKANAVEDELKRQATNWSNLLRNFDSRPAPQECNEFAGNYRSVLSSETQEMQRLGSILGGTDWTNVQSIQDSLSKLQTMKSDPNLQGNIDKAVENADGRLTTLCDSYANMPKPFTVEKETGGGSIIGPGL